MDPARACDFRKDFPWEGYLNPDVMYVIWRIDYNLREAINRQMHESLTVYAPGIFNEWDSIRMEHCYDTVDVLELHGCIDAPIA